MRLKDGEMTDSAREKIVDAKHPAIKPKISFEKENENIYVNSQPVCTIVSQPKSSCSNMCTKTGIRPLSTEWGAMSTEARARFFHCKRETFKYSAHRRSIATNSLPCRID